MAKERRVGRKVVGQMGEEGKKGGGWGSVILARQSGAGVKKGGGKGDEGVASGGEGKGREGELG